MSGFHDGLSHGLEWRKFRCSEKTRCLRLHRDKQFHMNAEMAVRRNMPIMVVLPVLHNFNLYNFRLVQF